MSPAGPAGALTPSAKPEGSVCIRMLAHKVPGRCRSPAWSSLSRWQLRRRKTQPQRCCRFLSYGGKKQRAGRNQTGSHSYGLMLKRTYAGLWLFFLGSKLRNIERSQRQRIKDAPSVPRKRAGEQAAGRRRLQGCPVVLHGTPSACHCATPVSRPSLQPQTPASRAQAVGPEAPEDVYQAAGSPRSEADHHLRDHLTQWFSSQLHTRITQTASLKHQSIGPLRPMESGSLGERGPRHMHFFDAPQGMLMTTPVSWVTDKETGVWGSHPLPGVKGGRSRSRAPRSASEYRDAALPQR